jgi:hypothetical protein
MVLLTLIRNERIARDPKYNNRVTATPRRLTLSKPLSASTTVS